MGDDKKIHSNEGENKMMQYTLAVSIGFFLVMALDRALRTNIIRLTPQLVFTTLIFLAFQLIFDNYFTTLGIWTFNMSETLGIFVPFIPIENLFFGIEMLWFTLILFEWSQRK